MISVCLATYNGAKYLKEQLDSILIQLSVNDEIIISDDGSSDATFEIIASYKDSRIKVYHNQNHHGVVPNFENALKHALGDYLFLCDQDDIWCSDKVDKCIKSLQSKDFVVHNALIVNTKGESTNTDYFTLRKTKYGYFPNLWKMGYLGCCMAFRRKCLKDILPFPKSILWHDMWIAAILHLKYKGILLSDNLIHYRRHDTNASPTTQQSHYSWGFRFKYRFYIFYHSLLKF